MRTWQGIEHKRPEPRSKACESPSVSQRGPAEPRTRCFHPTIVSPLFTPLSQRYGVAIHLIPRTGSRRNSRSVDCRARPGLPGIGLLIRRFRVRIPRGAPLGLDQGLCPFRNLASSSVATGRGYHDNDQGAGRPRSGGDEGKASRRVGSARVRRAQRERRTAAKRKMVDSGTGHVGGGVREAPERLRKVSWHGGAPLSGGRARRDCRVLRGLTEYSPSEDSVPERPSALFRWLGGFRNEPTRRTNGQQ
jgi:hypothetical protein